MSAAEVLALIESPDYYEAKPHKAQDDLERVRDALSALTPEPPTDDEPCNVCGWTGPRTQYIGIHRLPVAHPDGYHPGNWLTAIRTNTPLPTVDERKAVEQLIRDALRMGIGWPKDDAREKYVAERVESFLSSWRNRGRGPITDEEIERAARAMFDDPNVAGDGYTWAEMVVEDPTRADIWRKDARRVLEAARDAEASR